VTAAALYVQAALHATWGGPPLWPVVVGAVEVAMFVVFGFTAGALFPGRFAAPFAAIGAFLLAFVGFHAAMSVAPGSSTYGLLSPATDVPLGDIGVFYRVAPDLAIVQVMFMGGIAVALLGVLVLAPVLRVRGGFLATIDRAGRLLCAAGVVLLAVGTAAAVTAFALAGTAKITASGWDIPALHDAASDQPVPYTPDCAGTSFKVCVHPAFSAFLPAVAAALQPVAAEIAGLPGAPVRAEQVPSGDGVRASQGMLAAGMLTSGISGTPPVYHFNSEGDGAAPLWGSPPGKDSADWDPGFQQVFLTAFAATPATYMVLPAQQAVITALMSAVGSQPPAFPEVGNAPARSDWSPARIAAAAARFEALSSATRHAWLAAHLPALRAGHITLAQLP
jgi:hypothetical protein